MMIYFMFSLFQDIEINKVCQCFFMTHVLLYVMIFSILTLKKTGSNQRVGSVGLKDTSIMVLVKHLHKPNELPETKIEAPVV